MNNPDWQMIVLKLRKHYKCLTYVAPLVGLSADRLRTIARRGTKTMLWENGNKLLELHKNIT